MEFPKLSGRKDKEDYLKLSEYVKKYDHSKFLNEINDFFGYLYDKEDMDYIALYLQICVKQSRPMYLHGYVVSSALHQYIHQNKSTEPLTILETGTARGFADVVMAKILKTLDIGRIHFAFLDGAHYYKELTYELNYVEKNQQLGDIIICDDYTITQFPEICKAIDNFLSNNKYESKFFYGDDGTKKRGYVFMKKIR